VNAPSASGPSAPDIDAMLCALVLAPNAFSRNRFFQLFEQPELRRVRRRATRLRGILRQLMGDAEITGELELHDGRRLLRYRVPSLGLSRTAALSRLESATLRFALARAQKKNPDQADRALVEDALRRLGDQTGVVTPLGTDDGAPSA
jgi:hypothetical protein